MSENIAIVRHFIECWSRLDVDELLPYFAADGCYHNMPLAPVTGHADLRAFISGFLATWTATHWEILNIVGAGEIVIAERIDRTTTTQGNIDLPCVGVFEMEDGKIKIWRDYFDLATYTRAMQA